MTMSEEEAQLAAEARASQLSSLRSLCELPPAELLAQLRVLPLARGARAYLDATAPEDREPWAAKLEAALAIVEAEIAAYERHSPAIRSRLGVR